MTRRSLFVLGLLSFCLLLAIASPAFATTRHTRITGLYTTRTTNTYKDTGRVTYSKSGHYYSVSRAYVRVYRYIGGHWVYHTHIHATTSGYFKVSEPSGYTYKFSYAGVRGRYASTYATVKVVRPANSKLFSFAMVNEEDDEYNVGSSDTTTVTGVAMAYTVLDDLDTWGGLVDVQVKIVKLQPGGTYEEVGVVTADADGYWAIDLPIGEYRASIGPIRSFTTVAGITYDLVNDVDFPFWSFSVL